MGLARFLLPSFVTSTWDAMNSVASTITTATVTAWYYPGEVYQTWTRQKMQKKMEDYHQLSDSIRQKYLL